jgi:hypothetical protein
MVTPLLLLLATLLGTPDGGSTDGHVHAAGVDRRGDEGMGSLTGDGGVISAEALDPEDTTSRDSIRGHFAHIAHAFSAGDFDLPMFIHDRKPPGVDTMKRLRTKISYSAEDTPRGARVIIQTGNAEALAAVHDFLRFQIADHRTGDSPEVQR